MVAAISQRAHSSTQQVKPYRCSVEYGRRGPVESNPVVLRASDTALSDVERDNSVEGAANCLGYELDEE